MRALAQYAKYRELVINDTEAPTIHSILRIHGYVHALGMW